MSQPVTYHDFTPEACRDRLQKLLAEPHLRLSVQGAGVPDPGSFNLDNDRVLLIERDEVAMIIRHLNEWIEKRVEPTSYGIPDEVPHLAPVQ